MMGELHNQKALFSGVSIFCLAFLLLSMNTYFAHHFEFQFVCEVVKCLEKGQLIFSLGQRDRREETGKQNHEELDEYHLRLSVWFLLSFIHLLFILLLAISLGSSSHRCWGHELILVSIYQNWQGESVCLLIIKVPTTFDHILNQKYFSKSSMGNQQKKISQYKHKVSTWWSQVFCSPPSSCGFKKLNLY